MRYESNVGRVSREQISRRAVWPCDELRSLAWSSRFARAEHRGPAESREDCPFGRGDVNGAEIQLESLRKRVAGDEFPAGHRIFLPRVCIDRFTCTWRIYFDNLERSDFRLGT